MPVPQPLSVPLGPACLALLPRLAEALAGDAPVLPFAASAPPSALPQHDPADLPDGLAVVVGTSGSTGTPKRALLTAAALHASSRATHDQLGGPGQWLLALPAHHVAGLQVLLRSLDAGTTPVAMDLVDGFLPQAFVATTALLEPEQRRYTSLVPTQLLRLLDHPRGPDALRSFDAVLVGGAATAPAAASPGRAGARARRRHLRDERDRRWLRLRRKAVALHRDRFRRRGSHPPRWGHRRPRLPRPPRPDRARPSASTRTGRAGSAPTTSATPTNRAACTSTAASTTWSTPVG